MALGGGTFASMTKAMPGAYHNFISRSAATLGLAARGILALPMILSWGKEGAVIELTAEDMLKNSMKILGYDFTADAMRNIREAFQHAKTLYIYRLNGGTAATCTYGTAKYKGARGNALKIVITANIEEPTKFDVYTYLDGYQVDLQKAVETAAGLVDNDYISWKKDADLAVTAGVSLTGGEDAAEAVNGQAWQDALTALEAKSWNVIACASTDDTIKALVFAYVKRLREEVGMPCQAVGYQYTTPDHEAWISVENTVTDAGADPAALVYWVAGAAAGFAINRSLTNYAYNGEYAVDVNYTQTALSEGIAAGKFMFHDVGGSINVLKDVNSLVTETPTKGAIFKSNQTIRTVDELATGTARIFNQEFLGKVQNNESGRVSLQARLCSHRKQMQDIEAIQNFSDSDLIVSAVEGSNEAVAIAEQVNIVGTMVQLYTTTTIV